MILIHYLILGLLLPVLCFGPGFFFVRWLRWRSIETLIASIGASLLLIYLSATAIYLLHLNWHWAWLATLCGIMLTAFAGADLSRLIGKPHVHRTLTAFGFLISIGLLMLALIQHYSGGSWSGDWLEHYQRTIYFLDYRDPQRTEFINRYILPARPPMMNLLAAYFLAHVGSGFDFFQPIFQFFNLLFFFPLLGLASLLVRWGGRHPWRLAAVLALSPVVMENSTWTWTKLLTAFYILASLFFYIRAWRRNDWPRMLAAAVAMAGAILVHYSAGPYAVALFVHYLLVFWWRKHKLIEPLVSAGAGLLLLATWFAWSIAVFGTGATLKSNTTATDSKDLTVAENLEKVGKNIVSTLVPHPVIPWKLKLYFDYQYDQPNPFGKIRDYFFMLYQPNLTTAWGLVGWLAVAWLMVRQLRRAQSAVRWFWILTIPIITVLGIAAVGTEENYGVSHACLESLILLGLALLAMGLHQLPRWTQWLVVIGLAVDATLGVVLQTRMEMHSFRLVAGAGWDVVPITSSWLSVQAVQNSALRYFQKTTFLSDHIWLIHDALFVLFVLGLMAAIMMIAKKDQSLPSQVRGAVGAGILLLGTLICRLDTLMDYGLKYPQRPEPITNIEPLNRAVAMHPDSSVAHFERGMAYYTNGQVEESLNDWIEAFLLNPTDLRTRYLLFVLCVTHGITPLGIDAFAAELYLEDPHNVEAQMFMVTKLAARKHALPALRILRQAVMEHPENPVVQQTLQEMHGNLLLLNRLIEQLEKQANQ